ncbi:MogA/MoaB family molybdenum cofactor biosynthesis protein [Corynebacterium suicordis]|uniref:MogA/MoaB family molybdenum cofactor biosynthesis protein n=2 Tax=Corynebacterium suicordis TaxID=203264 RepID=A0ABR9ZIQ8_9CORY|nr:molybdopterin-binding protein [Corynebacterium suicordis]MBF4553094.1 MogA/MoaB family molybdenum cofactor biosynthesis protein [Corynebacterium suicordis DSM 45110]
MDSVDPADIDRLISQVQEPDDQVFHQLDMNSRSNGERREHALLHAMVVIISDEEKGKDQSGELVTELLTEENFLVDAIVHVESRKSAIRKAIQTAVVGGADLVITVGATGLGSRDKAPEAAHAEIDRKVPGIAEALRSSGLAASSLEAGLSRGVAGVSGSTVVVNLAGTRSAIRDGMATLCPLVRHVIADMNR